MKMTRRQFLGTAVIGAAAAACGGGPDDGTSMPDAPMNAKSCTTNGTTATIGTNHGHTLTVSAGDVMAGVDKTYDITGSADHPHMVTVTAANFTSLQNNPNGSVMLTSTSGGAHTHSVTILCA